MNDKQQSKPSAPAEHGKAIEEHQRPKEIGGTKGLDPTRYGDWEHNGRCTDF